MKIKFQLYWHTFPAYDRCGNCMFWEYLPRRPGIESWGACKKQEVEPNTWRVVPVNSGCGSYKRTRQKVVGENIYTNFRNEFRPKNGVCSERHTC